ncbi:2-hydroxyacyl-CoA dehydratase [Chloroflexota bacterium]
MVTRADYETRPISDEVWGMMKKIRRDHFWRTWQAQDEGGIVLTGINFGFQPLFGGFGTVATPSMGAGFTRIARMGTAEDGLKRYVNITTAKGLTPMCGAIAAHLGQVWEGVSFKNPTTEKEIIPDFIYCSSGCYAQQKGSQMCGDILGLPMLYIEQPISSNTENYIEYVTAQLADAIEWIEKRTGKTFDDEKFIESVGFNIQTSAYWASIADLTRNIPSPLSIRQTASLNMPLMTMAFSKEVMDYLEALYAEVQQRVKDGISGSPFERKRLSHQGGIHPMYRPDVLRWPEEYGAAFVMGWGVQGGMYTEDGERILPKSLEERGIVLKNREDALRALVDPFGYRSLIGERDRETRRKNMIHSLKDWHVDGVMLHFARRCALTTIGIFDTKSDLEKAGFIVGTYEASEGDPNEFIEAIVREDFSHFFDRLGLTKIEKGLPDQDEDD